MENNRDGVYRQRESRPMDNPEIKKNDDWWDEVCRANGEKNYWKKEKPKPKPKKKND